MVQQLTSWLSYKYRTRRVCHRNEQTGKTVTEARTPDKKESVLVFALYQNIQTAVPRNLYIEFARSFGKTLDRMNKDDREEGSNGRRRQITLHSFRRFVKTTISDLGYSDYSEYFIGHSGSIYWRKKELEKAELFKNRTLSDISKYPPTKTTRHRYTKQSRRARRLKSRDISASPYQQLHTLSMLR